MPSLNAKCKFCGARFRSGRACVEHVKAAHLLSATWLPKGSILCLPGYRRLKCGDCGANFRLFRRAIAHINKAHP